MDEKARFRRFAYGLTITLALTVLGGIFFGTFGVSMALMLGLLVTLLAGGGLGRKN